MERQRRLRKPNPRTSQEMEIQHIPPPSPQPEPSQPKVRKPRGPNKGRDAQTQLSKRPVLTIVGEQEFDADPDCSRIATTIRLIVCSNVGGPYTNYKEFPKDDRKQCLEEFLERYSWADGLDPDECEKVFEKIACNMYSSAMTRARRACKEKHGLNIEKWKEMLPDWLGNQEFWNSMCDQWACPSWKQVSDQNSDNRRATGNIVNHVSGTRSAFRHAKKMKKNNGVEPTYEDVFRKIHVKKLTEEFCDAKSKEVSEKYIFYKTNPEFSEEGDCEKWVRAAGGVSHGRLYGVGSVIDVSKVIKNKRSRSEPTPPPRPPPPQRAYTQEEVDAMILEERRRTREYLTTICNHNGLQMPPFVEDSSIASTGPQESQVNLSANE